MSACHPFRPVPGQCGPNRRGPLPAPPFNPQDYWATRKCVSRLFASLETKLDKADVVDPGAEAEAGEAADAKSTYGELNRILGVASDARVLAESKADKLTGRQLAAVNSGIDADKVAKIAQNESAISSEVSRATTEEARLRALVNAIKTFEVVIADSLPSPSEQYSKKLYLIPSANPETRNVKDEFICAKIEDVWNWEHVGSTAITIEFDNEPTEGSQKAARSGGIWSWVKSLLPQWLTGDYAEPATVASVANKRDKTDLDVYVFTEWTFEPALPDSYEIRYIDDLGGWGVYYNGELAGAVKGPYYSLEISWDGNEWSGGYPFTATRSRIQTADTLATTNGVNAAIEAHHDDTKRDKTDLDIKLPSIESCTWGTTDTELRDALIGVVPVFSNGKWSAVAGQWTSNLVPGTGYEESISFLFSGLRDDVPANATLVRGEPETVDNIAKKSELTAGLAAKQDKITASGILKGDGQGGVNEATKSSTSADPANADYRDPQDNTCHKTEFTEWSHDHQTSFGEVGQPSFNNGVWHWKDENGNNVLFANGTEDDTDLYFRDVENTQEIQLHSTRSKVCTEDKLFVTEDVAAKQADIFDNDGKPTDQFATDLLGKQVAKDAIDAEITEKGTAPDAHLEAPTDERLKLILADNSVAYDSAKALPYKLKSVIGDRVVATMTLNAASTDITLPTIAVNDTTVKDFILDVTNAYAVEGVATDAGINIPRTDFKLVTRDGESLTNVTTVKAGKSAFLCFTQKAPVVVDGTTYPCWCVIQLPFGDPS